MFNSFFFPRSLFISLSIHQCLSSSHPSSLYCCLPLVPLHLSLSLSLHLPPHLSLWDLCLHLYVPIWKKAFLLYLFSILSVFIFLLSTSSSPFLVFLFLSLFSLFFILISSFSAVCSSLLSSFCCHVPCQSQRTLYKVYCKNESNVRCDRQKVRSGSCPTEAEQHPPQQQQWEQHRGVATGEVRGRCAELRLLNLKSG